MDLVIDTLIVEEDREAHIIKHDVTLTEVQEVITGDYVFRKGKYARWILIGPTKRGRVLAVVIGTRSQTNTYGLVTARPADRQERRFYSEYTSQIGGESYGTRRAA